MPHGTTRRAVGVQPDYLFFPSRSDNERVDRLTPWVDQPLLEELMSADPKPPSPPQDAEAGVAAQGDSLSRLWGWLMTEVESKECTGPLSGFCFMTGFMCVSSCHSIIRHIPTDTPSEMPSRSLLFLCGVDSRRGILSRCVQAFELLLPGLSLIVAPR